MHSHCEISSEEIDNLFHDDYIAGAIWSIGIVISFLFDATQETLALSWPLASAFNRALHDALGEAIAVCRRLMVAKGHNFELPRHIGIAFLLRTKRCG